jgi:hypothetical protein
MKSIKLILCSCFLMAVGCAFAQTPQTIEADLLKSFKKIAYWDERRGDAGGDDSLEHANDEFSSQLQSITKKYPYTINQPFKSVANSGLIITTSDDGSLRIYSWDTALGGTMRKFKNLVQYKSGPITKSIILVTDSGGYEPFYSGLYKVKTGKITYYIGVNIGILSSAYITQGVKVFAIAQGKLDPNAKLIKTKSGLNNSLDIDSDLSASVNHGIAAQPDLTFDIKTQTIKIPLITAEGGITNKFITYKFNGQYFEKVTLAE